MKKFVFLLLCIPLLALSCSKQPQPEAATSGPKNTIKQNNAMTISSPAFAPNGDIPSQYTCEGASTSIPLEFKNIPEGAKSLAMLMDDPDVPKNLKPDGVFDHWVVFNLPPESSGIPEGGPVAGITGKNGAGQNQFAGPCPPNGEHRYFFRLYALDSMLTLDKNAGKQDVLTAMQGHILEQAELIGKYNKLQNRK